MTSTLHLRCPKKTLGLSSASKPNAPAENMWLVPRFLRVLGRNMENIKQGNYKFKSRYVSADAIWSDESSFASQSAVTTVEKTFLTGQLMKLTYKCKCTLFQRAVKSKVGWYNLKQTGLKKPEYCPPAAPVTRLFGRFQILGSSSRAAASPCSSPSPKWVLQQVLTSVCEKQH